MRVLQLVLAWLGYLCSTAYHCGEYSLYIGHPQPHVWVELYPLGTASGGQLWWIQVDVLMVLCCMESKRRYLSRRVLAFSSIHSYIHLWSDDRRKLSLRQSQLLGKQRNLFLWKCQLCTLTYYSKIVRLSTSGLRGSWPLSQYRTCMQEISTNFFNATATLS